MMEAMNSKDGRQLAAQLVRQFLEKQMDFDQMIKKYPKNTGDKNIDDLFNLMSGFPKVSGIFVKKESFKEMILGMIERLEK